MERNKVPRHSEWVELSKLPSRLNGEMTGAARSVRTSEPSGQLYGAMPLTPGARRRHGLTFGRRITLTKRAPVASAVIPYHWNSAP